MLSSGFIKKIIHEMLIDSSILQNEMIDLPKKLAAADVFFTIQPWMLLEVLIMVIGN